MLPRLPTIIASTLSHGCILDTKNESMKSFLMHNVMEIVIKILRLFIIELFMIPLFLNAYMDS